MVPYNFGSADRLQEEQARVWLVFFGPGCDVKAGADPDNIRHVAGVVQIARGVHVPETETMGRVLSPEDLPCDVSTSAQFRAGE